MSRISTKLLVCFPVLFMNCLLIAFGGIAAGSIIGYFANPMLGFLVAFSFVCPALHIALNDRQTAKAQAQA